MRKTHAVGSGFGEEDLKKLNQIQTNIDPGRVFTKGRSTRLILPVASKR